MTKAFDLLAATASFAHERGIALNEPSLVDQFLTDATRRLKAALQDTPLIHGTRTENLFEAMVVSLGSYRLFKTEDVGRVHASAKCRAPDFRVVLDDGEQWLIEVKNVRCEDPKRQRTRLSAAYIASLENYAALTDAPLRLAIYWSRWNLWSLVAPDRFRTADGGMAVTMEQAMMACDLGRLGDASIGTVAPLRLILEAAPDKPSVLGRDGLAEFTIGSVRIFSDQTELRDARDRKLAMVLFEFGEWPISEPSPVMEGGALSGVEFVAAPEEPNEDDPQSVGRASRIFSRYFATRTLDGDQVVQLKGDAVPEWFAPLAAWDFAGSRLPLWLFRLQPSQPSPKEALRCNDPIETCSANLATSSDVLP